MKINDFNRINRQSSVSENKAKIIEKDGFRQIMEQSMNNEKCITAKGLKELVKDSMSLTTNQIKMEIDSLCACETGENIDMERLNELLKLYDDSTSNK